MLIHLGQAAVVSHRDIVGIFDLDITSQSHRTRSFLRRAQQAGQVTDISGELPKSFVLCVPAGKKRPQTIFLSQLASSTLEGRAARTGLEEDAAPQKGRRDSF